jgi:hypothetical protein
MAGVTDLTTYCTDLADQLRLNGIREQKVAEIVAQVADHVVATGQDPVEAFSTPVHYAREWRQLHWYSWLTRLLAACAGTIGAWALIISLTSGEVGWAEDLHIDRMTIQWGLGFVPAVVLIWTAGLWPRLRERFHPGFEGRASMPFVAWVVLGMILAALLWGAISLLPQTGAVFSQPRWLVAAVGLVATPGLYFYFLPQTGLPRRPTSR